MTVRFRTFSQAPQAVRSASGRRWDWALSAGAPAGSTLQTDKSNAFGLTVQVHGLCSISSTAATRAVGRIHSSPPRYWEHCPRYGGRFSNRSLCVTNREQDFPICSALYRKVSRKGVEAAGGASSECANYLLFQRVVVKS